MGALLCTLLTLAVGGSGGIKYMETTLQDDAIFLHRPPAEVKRAIRQIRALGADRLRITASWASLAPAPRARRKPGAPFVASDPNTYPQDKWQGLDRAIMEASHAGIDVQIDVAFFAPRWATGKRAKERNRQRWWPDPVEFAQFAEAVARRYDGSHFSPILGAQLPAVRLFTTWNEPNETTFLMPQWQRTRAGRWRTASPHIYRTMHELAYDAIKRASPANRVLVGGTSSNGSRVPGKGGVAPLRFVRELACLDRRMQPLRVPECRNFSPIRADGFSHHPYSRFTPPGTSAPEGDDAPIADIGRLQALLHDLHERGRFASDLQLYITEYGYETRPPDPFQRYTPAQQAMYHGWATYLAWRTPDVPMFAQFLLQDMGARPARDAPGAWHDFQTGLYYEDGTPKPAAQAFRMPFWAELTRRGENPAVLLFGQVRPGDGPRTVSVERRAAGSDVWQAIKTYGRGCNVDGPEILTDPTGTLFQAAPYEGAASYRLAWTHGDITEHSAEVFVDAEQPVIVPG